MLNAAQYKGLSSEPDHYIERSKCLNDFRDMYGGVIPLLHSTLMVEDLASHTETKITLAHCLLFSLVILFILLIVRLRHVY